MFDKVKNNIHSAYNNFSSAFAPLTPFQRVCMGIGGLIVLYFVISIAIGVTDTITN